MRRGLPAALGLAGLLLGAGAIVMGGHRVLEAAPDAGLVFSTEMDADTERLALEVAGGDAASGPELAEAEEAEGPAAETPGNDYERVDPRPPLSDLALAKPPPPPEAAKPAQRRMSRLFNPVASSAGSLEAQGYHISLEGIEPTPADMTCAYQGRDWPCGAVARTTFRAWLRARAIQCEVPDVADAKPIETACHIGNQDVAQWLVENGWAKPVEGSVYAELGSKAQTAGRGLYGAPPSRFTVTIPATPEPATEGQGSFVTVPAAPPTLIAPETAEPPPASPAPTDGSFPPVPAAPATTP